jgi:hypothetical protein
MSLDAQALSTFHDRFKALPPNPKSFAPARVSKFAFYWEVRALVAERRAAGHAWEGIAEDFRLLGVDISTATLKTCARRARLRELGTNRKPSPRRGRARSGPVAHSASTPDPLAAGLAESPPAPSTADTRAPPPEPVEPLASSAFEVNPVIPAHSLDASAAGSTPAQEATAPADIADEAAPRAVDSVVSSTEEAAQSPSLVVPVSPALTVPTQLGSESTDLLASRGSRKEESAVPTADGATAGRSLLTELKARGPQPKLAWVPKLHKP